MVRVQSPVWNNCVHRLATWETGHYLWLYNCYVQPALNVFGLPLFVIETSRYVAVGVFLDQCNTDGFSTKSGRRMVTRDCRTPIKLFSYSHINKSKKFKIKTTKKIISVSVLSPPPPPPPPPHSSARFPSAWTQWFSVAARRICLFQVQHWALSCSKTWPKCFFPKTFCDYTL